MYVIKQGNIECSEPASKSEFFWDGDMEYFGAVYKMCSSSVIFIEHVYVRWKVCKRHQQEFLMHSELRYMHLMHTSPHSGPAI